MRVKGKRQKVKAKRQKANTRRLFIVHRSSLIVALLALCLGVSVAKSQQPTTTLPTAEMNAHYVSGRTWADFKPSKGTGLTLNIAAGTAQCAAAAYAGGTLAMTASQTNYVYLDVDADCAPDSNTTGFPTGSVQIAIVVAGGSAITTVTDHRGFFFPPGLVTSEANFKVLNNVRMCDQFPGANGGLKIQACIADLPAAGGFADARGLEGAQTISATLIIDKPVTLLLGAATYTFTKGIFIYVDDVSIIGAGIGKTIIKADPNVAYVDNYPILASKDGDYLSPSPSAPLYRILISDLTVDGNQANLVNSHPTDSYGNGINLNWAADSRVTRCEVKDVRFQGINIQGADESILARNNSIDHNWIHGFGEIGAGLEGGNWFGSITDNWIWGSFAAAQGVLIKTGSNAFGGDHNTVSGNHIWDMFAASEGVTVHANANYTKIDNNSIRDVEVGVRVSTNLATDHCPDHVSVTGNSIENVTDGVVFNFNAGDTSGVQQGYGLVSNNIIEATASAINFVGSSGKYNLAYGNRGTGYYNDSSVDSILYGNLDATATLDSSRPLKVNAISTPGYLARFIASDAHAAQVDIISGAGYAATLTLNQDTVESWSLANQATTGRFSIMEGGYDWLAIDSGTGLVTIPQLTAPKINGKVDRNDVAVDDDDCTSEQGLWWYDTTDSRFEFCNASTGVPTTLGGGGAFIGLSDVPGSYAGAGGYFVKVNSAATALEFVAGSAAAHDLLSATHTDTAASAPVLGGMLYVSSDPKWAQLAGNTAAVTKFLTQTGNGSTSGVPAWSTIGSGDIQGLSPTWSEQHDFTGAEIKGAIPFRFEGGTDNNIYWKISITDPTIGDKTTTVPNADTVLSQAYTCTNQVATALSGTTGATTCTTITSAYTSGTFAPSTESLAIAGLSDISGVTGSGTTAVLGTSPTFTTSALSPAFISTAADPADTGLVRAANNADGICWELATPGTDKCLKVNASDELELPANVKTAGASTDPGTVTLGLSTSTTASWLKILGGDAATNAEAPYIHGVASPNASGAVSFLFPCGTAGNWGIVATTAPSADCTTAQTVAKRGNTLGDFAATTSAQIYGVLSDETGSASGAPLAVFSVNPTLIGATLTNTLIVDNQKELQLREADGGGDEYLGLKAKAAITASRTLILNLPESGDCTGTNGGALTILSDEIVCSNDDGGAGSGDSITVATTAATDPDIIDSSRIDFTLDTGASPDTLTADIVANSINATYIDETADYSFTTLSGKQDRNNTAVDDDDCASERGLWWYDTTDSAFEFCNANSGAPSVLGGGGGAWDTLTAPTGAVSMVSNADAETMTLDFQSNFATDRVIIKSSTGNPTAGDLVSIEAHDTDEIPLRVTGSGGESLAFDPTPGAMTFTSGAGTNTGFAFIPDGTGDFIFGVGQAFTVTFDAGATDPVIDFSSGNIKITATTITVEGGATDPVWTPGNSIMNLSTGSLQQGGVLVGLTNAIGTTGTAPNWATATLNIPLAITASVTAGLISKTEFDTFNAKQAALNTVESATIGAGAGATVTLTGNVSGTDSVITLGSSSVDVTTGTLKEGSVAVSLPARSETLTEKTLNVESSNNVITTVSKIWIDAAACVAGTAATNWDMPDGAGDAQPTAACNDTGSIQRPTLSFSGSAVNGIERNFKLPSDWTGNIDLNIHYLSTAASPTGNVEWEIQTICRAVGETWDAAFNAAQTITDAQVAQNTINSAVQAALTTTTCAASEDFSIRIWRDGTNDTSNDVALMLGAELTIRRAQ